MLISALFALEAVHCWFLSKFQLHIHKQHHQRASHHLTSWMVDDVYAVCMRAIYRCLQTKDHFKQARWKAMMKGRTVTCSSHLLFRSWHKRLILDEVQSCDCIQMRNFSVLLGRQFSATARSKKHNSNIIKFNELLYAAADEWAPVYVSAEWICSGCWLVMSLSFSVLWGSLPFLFSWLWHALLPLFIRESSLFKELALNCCIKVPVIFVVVGFFFSSSFSSSFSLRVTFICWCC